MSHESLHRDEEVRGSSNRALGLTFAAVFLIVGLYPFAFGDAIRAWSVAVAGAFVLAALAVPQWLAPLNRLWTRFGLLLHKIVSPVVLGIMFFIVMTPIGLLMRSFGKDLLRLRMNRDAPTYWIEREPPGPKPDSFPNQF